MTGQGVWKDWGTQEYLEELIRLTFPAAKVNDIVPFTALLIETTPIVQNLSVLYFVKITTGILKSDDGYVDRYGYSVVGLRPDMAINIPLQTDFILIDRWYSENATHAYITGWKITLDNDIVNLGADEQPPIIETVAGEISNLVVFYAPSDDGNGSIGGRIGISVDAVGDVDAVQFYVGGVDFGLVTVVDGVAVLDAALPSSPGAVVQAIGIDTGTGFHANTLTYNMPSVLKHYFLRSWLYVAGTDRLAVTFDNLEIGTTYDVELVDPSDVTVETIVLSGDDLGARIFFAPGNGDVTAVPNSWYLLVTPTVNGVRCPFSFKQWLNFV